MENVEIAQKINNLAAELIKHKIVANYDDACKQAEVILGKVDKKEEAVKMENEELNKDVRKLSVTTRNLNQELFKLREEFNNFLQEFNSIKSEINGIRNKISAAPVKVKEETREEKEEEPEKILSKEEITEGHMEKIIMPKEPEKVDLSVEKIFYAGNKKNA